MKAWYNKDMEKQIYKEPLYLAVSGLLLVLASVLYLSMRETDKTATVDNVTPTVLQSNSN